jgi:hypothetical protein
MKGRLWLPGLGIALAAQLAGCMLPPKSSVRAPSIDAHELGLTAAAVAPADEGWGGASMMHSLMG